MKTKINIDDLLKTDSKNLAIMIVTHRVLGCWKEEAKLCMIELAKRRANGDNFDFELFIAEEVKKHQFKINIEDVLRTKNKVQGMVSQSIFSALIGFKNLGGSVPDSIDQAADLGDDEVDDLDLED